MDGILSIHFSLETPKGQLSNSADPDQTPLFTASDQGLHCLQIVKPFFSLGISKSHSMTHLKLKLDSPKIYYRSLFSQKWVETYMCHIMGQTGRPLILKYIEIKITSKSHNLKAQAKVGRSKGSVILTLKRNVNNVQPKKKTNANTQQWKYI